MRRHSRPGQSPPKPGYPTFQQVRSGAAPWLGALGAAALGALSGCAIPQAEAAGRKSAPTDAGAAVDAGTRRPKRSSAKRGTPDAGMQALEHSKVNEPDEYRYPRGIILGGVAPPETEPSCPSEEPRDPKAPIRKRFIPPGPDEL